MMPGSSPSSQRQRFVLFTLVILLLFSSLLSLLAFAEDSFTQTQFEARTAGAGLEILRSWQVLAVAALLLSSVVVAIAYAVGIGFELPDIKAWAGTELTQVFSNAILIVVLIVVLVFIDGLVASIVMSSGLPVAACSDMTKSCLQNVTNLYLEDYVSAAKDNARDVLTQNVDAAAWANKRGGIYCLTIYCLQAGVTTSFTGHYVLDMDMYAIVFEQSTNLLASMEAQKFFVNEISFKMGPLLLAVGIVARSFFFTRKLGGLLMSIAVGIMFFFPGMYIFDWFTLDTALAGDKAIEDQVGSCPAACMQSAPIAYVEDGPNLTSVADVFAAFSSDDANLAEAVARGTSASETGSNGDAAGKAVVSCYYGDAALCPSMCRELPYPNTVPACMNQSPNVQLACSKVPARCKVIRAVDTSAPSFDLNEYNQCPVSCKVVPPLRSNCDVDDCLSSRFDCRVYQRSSAGGAGSGTGDGAGSSTSSTSLKWWPNPPDVGDKGSYDRCLDAKDCPVSTNAFESCSYIVPATGRCDDLCTTACPSYCRIAGADLAQLPADCKDESGALNHACTSCPDSCKVQLTDITSLNPPAGQCAACTPEHRISAAGLPPQYTTGSCSLASCAADYRVVMPRNACEMCLFSEDSYAYSPPIETACSETCSPPDNMPMKEAGSYTKIGQDGLVGRAEIQNVSKLLLPAYILPLFNIVATVVFIKGLSVILGGDIEIPGLSKVF